MITVWKTVLPSPHQVRENRHIINIPRGSQILSVGMQGTQIVVWHRGNSEDPLVSRTIIYCETGGPAPSIGEAVFLGTLQLNEWCVLHVFYAIA